MRWNTPNVLGLLLAVTLIGSAAAANGAAELPRGAVSSDLEVWLVHADERGRERLLPGEQARPGDLVEYHVRYRNQSPGVVRDVMATLPIPSGLALEEAGTAPRVFLASLDNRSFRPAPLTRVVQVNGRREEVEIPHSEYRSIRWPVGSLRPGQGVLVKARARILD